MLGRVLNTHQQWICRQLSDRGYLVTRQVTVPDSAAEIERSLREALARADLILLTGGLGPTSDDLTRDIVATLLGKKLREDPGVLAHIQQFFSERHRAMPESTRVQALVPEGALVLPNPYGTAPGLALRLDANASRAGGPSKWLILLPGPPRELQPMFREEVVPLLNREFPAPANFVCRVLRTSGMGESLVEEAIAGPLANLTGSGLEIGYCARPGQVDVRLAAHGAEANQLIERAETIARSQLSRYLFATGEDELAAVIIRQLTERKQTLALAESCTGGLIAHQLTNVPGASAVFLAGLVTYSNTAKQQLLGVRPESLEQFGAVSEQVAQEMAEGARRCMAAEYALAVTGIAGPSGGTAAKPVGTVFVALASSAPTRVERKFNPYDRETFKQVTAQQALTLLNRGLLPS